MIIKFKSVEEDITTLKQLLEEYLELKERNNITLKEFLTYLEIDHSDTVVDEFKKIAEVFLKEST
jgi:hypothetical protein